jgi:hypothetical protein
MESRTMRTVFVNPSKRRGKRKSHKRRTHRKAASNPIVRHRRAPRRRRRNAGITPFVASSNPQLMANPRRRVRRRYSNPLASPKKVMVNALLNVAGSSVGAGLNYFGISKIQNVYGRNGTRIAASVLSALVPGQAGGALAGAFLMPMWVELFEHIKAPVTTAPTEADLDALAADLEDLMAD